MSFVISTFNLSSSSIKQQHSLCEACCLGKHSQIHLSLTGSVSNKPLELIHGDVWGPAPELSFTGDRYFAIFVDDFSRFCWLFPLKRKSDVCSVFVNFHKAVERQFNAKILNFQSDWGGEFRAVHTYLKEHGIHHRITCPHTHQQNGTVERKIRHVVDTCLTMLAHSSVPRRFWTFGVTTAAYLVNRLPSPVLQQSSPYEKLFGTSPDYNFLRVFGCTMYPLLRPFNRNKFSYRSAACVFLGYSNHHLGYICFNPTDQKIYLSRHVRVDESRFLYKECDNVADSLLGKPPSEHSMPWLTCTAAAPSFSPQSSSPTLVSAPSSDDHTAPAVTDSATDISLSVPHHSEPSIIEQTAAAEIESAEPLQVALPSATSAPPIRTHPMLLRPNPKKKKFFGLQTKVDILQESITEPSCYSKAIKIPIWREAMSKEISALLQHQTWTLVPKPLHTNIVGNKWVFKVKRNPDGTIERCKARLVAKGYNQVEGIDYEATFSPVIKSQTIRIILSLAVSHKWEMRQLDISNAFLHGYLEETVYMSQPPGFTDPRCPSYVCKLNKSIYGLKQAPRAWFQRLSAYLVSIGFEGSHTDSSLFIYKSDAVVLYILLYVDDIVITGNSSVAITTCLKQLSTEFKLRDLGRLHYFLGIEVLHLPKGILLSQQKYLQDLLKETTMDQATAVKTPMAPSCQLHISDGEPMDNPTLYRKTVGALQYACLTRPDLAFAVNKLCQFLSAPTTIHWAACKRVLRYVKGTIRHGLFVTPSPAATLQAFCDADWAGNAIDRRSTGGFAIYLGPNLISWSTKKQPTVARSSTEAEYRSVANTVAELIWIRSLLTELKQPLRNPTVVWCDNIGASYLAINPCFKARTKHIEVDFHFVREQVKEGHISVHYISSLDQLADIFTKPLSSTRFLQHKNKLRILDRDS